MNGDLTVTGRSSASPTLAGTINLGRTVITVPDQLPGSLAALDVQAQERDGRGARAGRGAVAGRRRRPAAAAG